jgi:NitT/TauT family transport system permease protein
MSGKGKSPTPLRRVLEVLVLCAILGLVWELLTDLRHWDTAFVASPSRILQALIELRSQFLEDLLFTLRWIIWGTAFTVVAAVAAAILLHLLPEWISRPVYGVLVVLQCIPVFALTPALVYWAGIGSTTRLITIFLVSFFPALVSTADGLRTMDPDLVDLFKSMKASRWQTLIRLELPSALAMVLVGIKVTFTMSAIGVVVAELMVTERIGLGYRPKEALSHYRMDEAFAAMLLLAGTVALLYGLLSLALRKLEYVRRDS